jgi:hypothetical protein
MFILCCCLKITPNVFQAGVRFLLCQVTHLSVNTQKMVACLVLAGRNRHTVYVLLVPFFIVRMLVKENIKNKIVGRIVFVCMNQDEYEKSMCRVMFKNKTI